MTASLRPPPVAPPGKEPRVAVPWIPAIASGVAVLLADTPVSVVVQGTSWTADAAVAVAVVVAAGLLLHRWGAAAVAAGQCLAVLLLLTAMFADDGVLGVLPGPAAVGEFGTLVAAAGQQIDTGTAPVEATPQILFLVTAAFGVLAVGVHLAAVTAGAPAAAGVPLLAVFAVPAALADELLPWWAMAGAAVGFGLLLVAAGGARRLAPGGAALVAGAVVLALGIGAGTGFVGTAGRFEGGAGGQGSGGSIGLSPFTALRGQLEETSPVELFRVRGLDRATYLRALTLRDYVPLVGWQATRPAPGAQLPGPIQPEPGTPGDVVDVQIENLAFRDYWLPLYGLPLDVAGLPESQWVYDPGSGTGYTARPRQEDGWQQRALLPSPTVDELRAARGAPEVDSGYLDTAGVDRRVVELAQQVVAGQDNAFDRAVALQEFFTGPDSAFRYSLQTAPGAGDDALVEFLTVGRTGYCEQFASAMAVMLRAVGVPARVAVGFTAGTENGDYRSISTSDAHAWVEAWFPGPGWTTFDPTPLTDGRSIIPPYVAEARGDTGTGDSTTPEDALRPGEEVPQDVPAAPVAPEQAAPEAAAPQADTGGGLPLWPFVALLLVVGVALVPAALRARERRRRLAAVRSGGPDAAGAGWAELLAESEDRGVPGQPSDTVRGAARRLVREHRLDAGAQQALREVVTAVESSWYGDGTTGVAGLEEPVRTVRTGIAAGSAVSLRQRLLPRSVLRGAPALRGGSARRGSALRSRSARRGPDDATQEHETAAPRI